MSHCAFVSMSGLRVKESELLELGMSLPGLRKRSVAISELPALGLLTLAGLTPFHWECSYHEAIRCDDQFIESILAEKPSLVAISALSASVLEAYSLSHKLRERGALVVIGGLHVTACSQEAARHCDAVIVGEGEPLWRELLEDVEANRLKKIYQTDQPFDLKQSPLPRWDLLGPRERPRMTLQTARGCPFACEFCGASRLLGPFREKPLENIVRELNAIRSITQNPWLELADDNSFAGSRNYDLLFEALAKSGVRYFTEADWRIGQRPELLSGLAASGCVQVLVGVESLVLRYGGMGVKSADLTQVMDSIRAIQDAGVAVNGCFIIGADGETNESLNTLAEFILDSPLAEVQITLQTPFPGTALYQRLKKQGRLLKHRDWSYYTLFDVVHQPDKMTVEQLERGFRNLLQSVFCSEASKARDVIRHRIWQKRKRSQDKVAR